MGMERRERTKLGGSTSTYSCSSTGVLGRIGDPTLSALLRSWVIKSSHQPGLAFTGGGSTPFSVTADDEGSYCSRYTYTSSLCNDGCDGLCTGGGGGVVDTVNGDTG